MVVDDLDLVCIAPSPLKTDTPSLIDANAVLPNSIAHELLESISRRNPQVIESSCDIENLELATSISLHLRR